MPSRALLTLALAATLAGCAADFVPGSVIVDRRVLALVASPPELDGTDPGATTTVAAVEAAPSPPPALAAEHVLERRWTFCPFSTGAATGYACAVPACEVALAPGPDGAVTLAPVALAAACLAGGVGLPPDLGGGAGALPATVEVLVRYRLVDRHAPATGPALPEVVLREAVQRIPVWTTAPTAALNTAPAFADPAVTLGGAPAVACPDTSEAGLAACPASATLAPGLPLRLVAAVTPGSFESYPAADRTVTENVSLSFFTTAGRFTEERGAPPPPAAGQAAAPSTDTLLEHLEVPPGTTAALLWVVARDLRGGQVVAGPFKIDVAP